MHASSMSITAWLIGIPAVIFAVTVSFVLYPPTSFAWAELLGFIPFFLRHSLSGGIDVARRVFDPALPISPGLVVYRLRLSSEPSQVFLANVISLLPGTLSVGLEHNVLTIHVLDRKKTIESELSDIEQRVARLFRTHLKLPGVSEQ